MYKDIFFGDSNNEETADDVNDEDDDIINTDDNTETSIDDWGKSKWESKIISQYQKKN